MNIRVYLLAACLCLASEALTQDYDVVILGGRVMDPETGYDAIANVGISDGRIAAITTEDIAGDYEIDAGGLVVTAGFISLPDRGERPS